MERPGRERGHLELLSPQGKGARELMALVDEIGMMALQRYAGRAGSTAHLLGPDGGTVDAEFIYDLVGHAAETSVNSVNYPEGVVPFDLTFESGAEPLHFEVRDDTLERIREELGDIAYSLTQLHDATLLGRRSVVHWVGEIQQIVQQLAAMLERGGQRSFIVDSVEVSNQWPDLVQNSPNEFPQATFQYSPVVVVHMSSIAFELMPLNPSHALTLRARTYAPDNAVLPEGVNRAPVMFAQDSVDWANDPSVLDLLKEMKRRIDAMHLVTSDESESQED